MRISVFFILLTFVFAEDICAATDTLRVHLLKMHKEYQEKRDFFNDYLLLNRASEHYKKTKEMNYLADTYNKLGNLFDNLGEPELALKNFQLAESCYEKCGDSISTTKIKLNMANCLFSKGEEHEAFTLLKALELSTVARQDTAYYASVLFSLLRSFLNNNDTLSYYHYVEMLNGLPLSDPMLEYKRATHRAFSYYLKGDYDMSVKLYHKALADAVNNNDPVAANCMLGLVYNFTEMQRYDSATVYWSRYYAFKDSLDDMSHISQIRQLESLNTIKNYEVQLHQEHEKRELLQQIMILAFVLMTLGVAGTIVVMKTRRQKERVERDLEESKSRELSAMLENEQLQNEARKMELENQNRRLCFNLMVLEEKINVLKSIQKQIVDANGDGKVSVDIAKTIETQIKYHLQDTSNWNAFKESFAKIHPTFFKKLKSMYPNLSEHELRFCAFTCSGLDSKQIAFILNIQVESIRKIRQRLRKKLGLQPSESLEELLRTFIG